MGLLVLFMTLKKQHSRFCGVFFGFLGLFFAPANALEIEAFEIGAHDAHTRIVLELSETVNFNVFILSDPYRAVIDLLGVSKNINDFDRDKGLIKGVRVGLFDENTYRLVFDLRGAVKIKQQFLLSPSASSVNHRLVVDLAPALAMDFKTQKNAQIPLQSDGGQQASQAGQSVAAFTPKPRPVTKHKVIVLDPGHGGVDSGAKGRKVNEKDVVLTFARELAKQLKSAGYIVYMTRTQDIYIPLRERVEIGRQKKAELFISIHADANKKRKTRGLSIYTLSETASDKEAAALALKENQSDIIAGIDFADKPPEVANILIDLAQRESKNLSVRFAKNVVEEAAHETRLLERTHRYAGFRVLKAPDVPSVLIELGFLTNKSDEKQVRSSKWRRRVAKSLRIAIDTYFRDKQKRSLQ